MPFTTHASLAARLISRAAFLNQAKSAGTVYDKLVIGVAVIHPLPSVTKPFQVLMVQRAAHEKVLPGIYELPGGHVEDTDATILDAVVREVYEETGLHVGEITGEIGPFEYSVEQMLAAAAENAAPMPTVKRTLQLNFVAKVSPNSDPDRFAVTLNPEEHQNHAWVSSDDLSRYPITENMKAVVREALGWAEKNAGELPADFGSPSGSDLVVK